MGQLAANKLTLLDHAKRRDPNGKTAKIVELLGKKSPLMDDLRWLEGNLPTGHQTTIRTGLPTPIWRMFNQGVSISKSRTAQVTEGIGNLSARNEMDVKLAKLGGDVNGLRMSESKPFYEALAQEYESTFWYGNASTAPEEFTGMAARYSSLSAENGQNIVNGGGTDVADSMSIWLIVHGEDSLHGIFPKGSTAGIVHEDLGIIDAFDASSNRFRAYAETWDWDCGIALKDWRQCVRIANIDVSAQIAQTLAANLTHLMIDAMHRVHDLNAGQAFFYMNRTAFHWLDVQRYNNVSSGGQLAYEVIDGKRIPFFREVPIRIDDSLLETEAVVA